ncbi:uncharacterized protein [Eurosta solidaginis]|uniref:uncharacterized protein n=1 Tax=Eurosta solidaginis TaxID=178769 RepID=UPI0035317483
MLSGMADSPSLADKYEKLASEYSKLRGRASVLRNAVLVEKSNTTALRDQLRQNETALRRSEQELDSLGFRNKQLEHRVAVLQEEIAIREGRSNKNDKEDKRKFTFAASNNKGVTEQQTSAGGGDDGDLAQDALIFEELQKKIMENAKLTTTIDDKERDLQLHAERIANLEKMLEKRVADFTEIEKQLRRDLETLQMRNTELETKLVEAVSMVGSEDAVSVNDSEHHTPLHNTITVSSQNNHTTVSLPTNNNTHSTPTPEERISSLEKEVVHWRTQYEIAKINESLVLSGANVASSVLKESTATKSTSALDIALTEYNNCSCSSTAAGLMVKPNTMEGKSERDSSKEPFVPPTKEQLIYNTFSRKFEDLLKAKCLAESRITSYETEAEHFQICLENATHELKAKDEQITSINQALQILEEDLATTRINYEEQISVLTEQVINLSEQLAAYK